MPMAKKPKNPAFSPRRPNWSELDKLTLWSKCAGRCEMCNKLLYKSDLSQNPVNLGQFAHVIGHSDLAARGNKDIAREFRDSIDNIMLLCHSCHKDIDDNEGLYPEEVLFKIKKDFEEKIEAQTTPTSENCRKILIFTAPINGHPVLISKEETIEALRPTQFPMGSPMCINIPPIRHTEKDAEFWEYAKEEMEYKYANSIAPWLDRNPKLALFALAPQPLLVYLGWLLGEKCDKQVFQRHRDAPQPWRWQSTQSLTRFIVSEPTAANSLPSKIAISFSISFDIKNRVSTYLDDNALHWDVSVYGGPHPECIDTPALLADFRDLVHQLLNKVTQIAGESSIHIYMAMPVSLAVTLGMSIMPKATSELILHDYVNATGLDVEAIKINTYDV